MRRGLTRRTLLGHVTGATLLAQTPVVSPVVSPPSPAPAGATPSLPEDPLRRLRPEHPRLFLLDSELDRLRTLTKENPLARRMLAELEKEGDRLLSVPPAEYRLNNGRMQTQTRRIIDRVTTLALLYRLSGRSAWLRRAVMELNAGSNFRDWNPTRFVDTAEMMFAFAVGYDWLYNGLTPEERTWMRDAMLAKGLDQGLPFYRQKSWWTRERLNWNVVSNCAMTVTALALADEAREKCVEVLRAMYESAPFGLNSFGSDGSWPEGPYFGEYTLRYACLLLSGLETALNGDMTPPGLRGIEKAGRFRAFMLSPANRLFNYGDGPEEPVGAPEMYFLGRRFGLPGLVWSENRVLEKISRLDPLHLAWFEKDSRVPQGAAWPLDAVFPNAAVAVFRSAWDDPNALFLAVKGGDNKASHAHLDLGSFVFGAGGVRWASDLGGDDYTLSTLSRNSFYRVRTESHNTVVVEGENQDPRAEARLGKLETSPDLSWVQIDLSRTSPRLRRWTRRIGMAQRQAVLVEDSIRSDQPIDVLWAMMTDADISVSGPTATLHKNGWNLQAEIRSPRHAVFDTAAVHAAPPQAQNPRSQRLVVRLLEKVTEIELTIVLTPYRDGQPRPKITAQFPV